MSNLISNLPAFPNLDSTGSPRLTSGSERQPRATFGSVLTRLPSTRWNSFTEAPNNRSPTC
jgi:hypothetical protein